MPFDASLYFPQWQGGPNGGKVAIGSRLLHERLRGHFPFKRVPTDDAASPAPKQNIWHYEAVCTNMKNALAVLAEAKPRALFTLGGDCSIDVPVIDYLHGQYPGTLGVVWIDAHADINTPQSSPSQFFHGMPLRALLGEGDGRIGAMLKHPLTRRQVIYAGIRSIDAPEQDYIAQHRLPVLSSDAINKGDYALFTSWLAESGIGHLHIHFDLDALDPSESINTTYKIAQGIKLQAMADFLRFLHGRQMSVGFTVTEYAPDAETPNAGEIEKIVALISAVVPLRKILAA
jgi:arginase